MVSHEINWEGYLQDATFFPPADPFDLNFDEYLNSSKGSNEALLDASIIGDLNLNWLDEKMNLTNYEIPAQSESLDLFCSLLNPDSSINPSIDIKNEFDILNEEMDLSQIPVASDEDSKFILSSVFQDPVSEASSPANFECNSPAEQVASSQNPAASDEISKFILSAFQDPISDASSPASFACSSPATLMSSDDYCPSPSSDSYGSDVISVTVCNEDLSSDPVPVEVVMSFDEITTSVKKRKYVNRGRGIPKIRVSLKEELHPYARSKTRRYDERNERKKVQNKEAAARYRIKKRVEEQEVSHVVNTLETDQKELQKKHDSLVNEIKYLKALMREMLEKKGIL